MSETPRERALAELERATEQIAALETAIINTVVALRKDRATWREIAAALHTTPSNAHRKYQRWTTITTKENKTT